MHDLSAFSLVGKHDPLTMILSRIVLIPIIAPAPIDRRW